MSGKSYFKVIESLTVTESENYMMRTNRRKFISTALAGGLAATWSRSCVSSEGKRADYARLDEILKKPVPKKELFVRPVIIKSLELLRYKRSFLCRVRSSDGAEDISVGHSGMNSLYPIFVNALKPFFIDKDARELDLLLEKVYIYNLNFNNIPAGSTCRAAKKHQKSQALVSRTQVGSFITSHFPFESRISNSGNARQNVLSTRSSAPPNLPAVWQKRTSLRLPENYAASAPHPATADIFDQAPLRF